MHVFRIQWKARSEGPLGRVDILPFALVVADNIGEAVRVWREQMADVPASTQPTAIELLQENVKIQRANGEPLTK